MALIAVTRAHKSNEISIPQSHGIKVDIILDKQTKQRGRQIKPSEYIKCRAPCTTKTP